MGVYEDGPRLRLALLWLLARSDGIGELRDQRSCTGSSRLPHDINDLRAVRMCMRVDTGSHSSVVLPAWDNPARLLAGAGGEIRLRFFR